MREKSALPWCLVNEAYRLGTCRYGSLLEIGGNRWNRCRSSMVLEGHSLRVFDLNRLTAARVLLEELSLLV